MSATRAYHLQRVVAYLPACYHLSFTDPFAKINLEKNITRIPRVRSDTRGTRAREKLDVRNERFFEQCFDSNLRNYKAHAFPLEHGTSTEQHRFFIQYSSLDRSRLRNFIRNAMEESFRKSDSVSHPDLDKRNESSS